MVKEIVSERNPVFKKFLKLTEARGIKRSSKALFSGPKHVREVIREFPHRCEGIISTADEGPTVGESSKVPFYRLSRGLFRQLDIFQTGSPLLVAAVPSFPRWTPDLERPGCTLCVPFQDPANVGAVIRSAAAFGVRDVVILKEAAHPFLPKSCRAAGAALFRVSMWEGPSIRELPAAGAAIIAVSQNGTDAGAYRFPPHFCLVPGLEGPGLPPTLKYAPSLSIPMEPGVDSLNAAIATGIVLYLWRQGMQKA